MKVLYNTLYVAPSSSGLGHQAFILKIAGSNPAGVTGFSLLCNSLWPGKMPSKKSSSDSGNT